MRAARRVRRPEPVVTTWYSPSAPAGLPRDIVDRLNREVNKAMDVPKLREHLVQDTVQTRPMTPEQMPRFMKSDVDTRVPAAKAMNIVLQ